MVWRSSNTGAKEKLQTLIFPDGIIYDRQNETFRTPKVNYIFIRIAQQVGNTSKNEKGTDHLFDNQSLLAAPGIGTSNQIMQDWIDLGGV
ncbi:hypothetical protein BW716_31820 [[Flexibacter] sp. ATCC 35208]|nr:hypothetical protein BW716_31820 [[Flexibacter] sp. ATCC 35208]